MNCFYCNVKMEERYDLYICNNKINYKFYHMYEVEKSNINDKEFSFWTSIETVCNDLAWFVTKECINESPQMLEWGNYFPLEDFNLLKEIKTIEQLNVFINKLKVFK